ncbi:MAG TPA: hypothetical protein VGC55_02830 [Dokdonella sp.]
MRIGIAALLGAIVIFFWQFASHMLLPVGTMGFRLPQAEDAVLQSVSAGLPQAGIYLLPSIDPAKMGDKPTMDAWVAKAKVNPSVFVVVATPKADPASMGAELGTQFVSNLVAAVLVAWVLAATAWGFGARVTGATAFGVFGWLANILPQWNWYRFPSDFLVGNLIDQGVGWLLAGVAIAWWLGRR